MSNVLESQSNALKYDENGVPMYMWPPLPTPPPGVTILPFKEFKPSGIQIESSLNDDVELDGMGIPTVPLSVNHDNSGKRSKKRRVKLVDGQEVYVRYIWHEEWEIGEAQRIKSAPNYPKLREQDFDTVAMAFEDFRKGRDWGPPDVRLHDWFNQLIYFVGLNVITIKPVTSKKPKKEDENESDEEFTRTQQDPSPVKAGSPDNVVHEKVEDPEAGVDEKVLELYKYQNTLNVIRNKEFMNDPHQAMKVFFSSFFRDRGMLWDSLALRDCPRLVEFLLDYMIKTNAHPEAEKVIKALEITRVAKHEIPMTKKISVGIPDKFSYCLVEIFGNQIDNSIYWREEEEHVQEEVKEKEKEQEEGGIQTSIAVETSNGMEEILPEDTKWETENWTSTNGWGTYDDSGWGLETHNLVELLGPTTLPLTHKVGYVEDSTRKIAEVRIPDLDLNKEIDVKDPMRDGEYKSIASINPFTISCSDPFKLFAEVVLEPYENFTSEEVELTAVQNPVLLKDPFSNESNRVSDQNRASSFPIHNPERDPIKLLVSYELALELKECIGMAIGGTFVQVVPDQMSDPSNDSKIFWYTEKVLQVLPSFWTERPWTNLTFESASETLSSCIKSTTV